MTDVAILQSLEFVTPYEFEANNKHLYLVLIGVFCVTLKRRPYDACVGKTF